LDSSRTRIKGLLKGVPNWAKKGIGFNTAKWWTLKGFQKKCHINLGPQGNMWGHSTVISQKCGASENWIEGK